MAYRSLHVWGHFDIDAGSGSWPFTKLIPIMGLAGDENDPRRDELGRQLDVSAMLFGKIWKLDPLLRFISGGFGMGVLLVAVVALVWLCWDKPLYAGTVTIGPLVLALVAALATATLPVLRLLKPQKVARSWVVKIWLATIGAVLAKLHLKVFDPMFIKQGRLARLLGMK